MPRSGGKGGTAALAWPSLIFIGSPLEFGSPLLFFLKHLPSQEIELEALKRLLNSKWRSPLCKTLKFDARPSLPQLTAQLRGVTPNLPAMMAANKSFHITSHTKWP
eukprot:g13682.t1